MLEQAEQHHLLRWRVGLRCIRPIRRIVGNHDLCANIAAVAQPCPRIRGIGLRRWSLDPDGAAARAEPFQQGSSPIDRRVPATLPEADRDAVRAGARRSSRDGRVLKLGTVALDGAEFHANASRPR